MVVFLIALTLVGWQALRLQFGFKTASLEPPAPSPKIRGAIVFLGLPLTALAQNALGFYGALYVTPLPHDLTAFPLHLLAYTTVTASTPRTLESAVEFAIVAAQAFMLWRLSGASDGSIPARHMVVGAALLALVSLTSPLLTSSDIYFYVGAGILGFGAYAPPHMPFSGQFAPLNHRFIVDGTTYGPIWIALNALVTHCGTTFLQKIEALRIGNMLVFLGCFFLLGRCNIGKTNRCVFLLNPYMWFYFVATPHNDIYALLFIVAALAIAVRRPAVAVAFIAAAGLIKLPFLLFGSVVFARFRSVAPRCLGIALSGGMCLTISWLVGGPAYFHALLHAGHYRTVDWDPVTAYVLGIGSAACIGSFLLAAVARKWNSGAALLAPAVSPFPFPSYALWGLPYALTENRRVGAFLAAYPLVGFAFDDWFARQPYVAGVLALLLWLASRDVLAMLRLRRAGA